MKKQKTFDAVGFMREVRDRMSEEMRGMSPRERIDYIRRKSGISHDIAHESERRIAAHGPLCVSEPMAKYRAGGRQRRK